MSLKHVLNFILNIEQWTKSPSSEWSQVALFICRDVCPSVCHLYLWKKKKHYKLTCLQYNCR